MTVYFAVDESALTVGWRMVDLCTSALFLFLVWYLYRRAFGAIIMELAPLAITPEDNDERAKSKSKSRDTGASRSEPVAPPRDKAGKDKLRTISEDSTVTATDRGSIALTDLPTITAAPQSSARKTTGNSERGMTASGY
eukprot:CAMPEP_0197037992 /NCGR_PEP_ID=MMETSP1384-20130603/15056_1 /TAXON_ID=29189 /ORGANISM="Ammonia sp." /LENGTH=138 /DNA_ID=CAMNT_0042468379 /DNA_START=1 /DNA_END=414 /DNA_ORIENTATION=-